MKILHAQKIRRRTDNAGSGAHHRKITVRVTTDVSNEVASIQGLMYAFGRRETLAEVFERVLLPAWREYVKPYAERAKMARAARKEPQA